MQMCQALCTGDPYAAVGILGEAEDVGFIGSEAIVHVNMDPVIGGEVTSIRNVHAVGCAAPDPAAGITLQKEGVGWTVARVRCKGRRVPSVPVSLKPRVDTLSSMRHPNIVPRECKRADRSHRL